MMENESPGTSGSALVRRAHKGKIFSRKARGFSSGELAKAGVDLVTARRLGLQVDVRRRTTYDFNVDLLRKQSAELQTESAKTRESLPKEQRKGREVLVETVEAAE